MFGSFGTGACTVTSSTSGASRYQSACAISESTALSDCFEPSTASRIFMSSLSGVDLGERILCAQPGIRLTRVKSPPRRPDTLVRNKGGHMYSHILVCTDGSKLSQKAIRTAVRLAGALGARLTGAFVGAPYAPPVYTEGMFYAPYPTRAQQLRATQSAGRKAL